MKKNFLKFSLIITLSLLAVSLRAEDWVKVQNLSGEWKFNIGDDPEWIKPGFKDSKWEKVNVPSSWENQGFHGYNGYGWYRKTFVINSDLKNSPLEINLGYIDDVDEVFFNGKLIGFSGSFPPNYSTAYYAHRKYPIPNSIINFNGENTIAVRIYDAELEGGITSGDIGIFAKMKGLIPDLDLSGLWKFKIYDDLNWKEANYNDSDWDQILVPGYWETSGYRDYDGHAWYRKEFELPNNLKNEKLVLLLGRIDDIDEVYLNGNLIGSTGKMDSNPGNIGFYNEYIQFRGYFIPENLINKKGKNIIAVRVYDGYKDGGIYDGPIGLITQNNYSEFWKNNRSKKKSIFDLIFN